MKEMIECYKLETLNQNYQPLDRNRAASTTVGIYQCKWKQNWRNVRKQKEKQKFAIIYGGDDHASFYHDTSILSYALAKNKRQRRRHQKPYKHGILYVNEDEGRGNIMTDNIESSDDYDEEEAPVEEEEEILRLEELYEATHSRKPAPNHIDVKRLKHKAVRPMMTWFNLPSTTNQSITASHIGTNGWMGNMVPQSSYWLTRNNLSLIMLDHDIQQPYDGPCYNGKEILMKDTSDDENVDVDYKIEGTMLNNIEFMNMYSNVITPNTRWIINGDFVNGEDILERDSPSEIDLSKKSMLSICGYNFHRNLRMKETWCYRFATKKWDRLPMKYERTCFPNGVESQATVYFPDLQTIVLFGGYTKTGRLSFVFHCYLHPFRKKRQSANMDSVSDLKPRWEYIHNTEIVGGPAKRNACVSVPCIINHREKMLIHGGYSGLGFYGDMWLYDPISREWEEVTYNLPFNITKSAELKYNTSPDTESIYRWIPYPRAAHAGFLHENRWLFIFGGEVDLYTYTNELWMFDLSRRRWQKLSIFGDIPKPVAYHIAEVFYDHFLDPILVVNGGQQMDRTNSHEGYVMYLNHLPLQQDIQFKANLLTFLYAQYVQPSTPTSQAEVLYDVTITF